ncbi:TetR family transcriptional regulator [Actinoplanes sp. SE50]|uniref:TetR/AcrR family transcriptional regulator n=1 Tax=unclassified Actinoplanes TaxID=2626549 RepID=UPI00023EBE02|nr:MULTISPECIES: TetR/AcrR family transcriptional regulator [unclassified Actinoplanes]AEV87432.1 HTH-type transcriptional regulator mtrR [Actinoplanes sp. SE50/110]ATO85834.1 TetR family transcriptional regulator [Actinoplanes sp. SE50]SLM03248.1 TetR family transcriptional regulator [Actinoplanes sp. SE50/110]
MGHREELLKGAKKALLEKGYARTTARDIVALSRTNLASIGYHYGSTEALMTAAMLSAMEDWGNALGRALAAPDPTADPLLDFWRRVIGSIQTDRPLWLASIEVALQAEHNPQLKEQLAGGLTAGRTGMAAMLTGIAEDQLDEATVRSLGAVQMALMSGVVTQWLTDPASAPSAEEVVAGVRMLATLAPA